MEEKDGDAVEWSRLRSDHLGYENPDGFAAMAALLRTHQVMLAELERTLQPFGLTLTGYLLLTTLLMTKEHRRPLGQLSSHLLVHPTTVTLVTDQFVSRGLIRRVPHASDRRVILAELTDDGTALIQRANTAMASNNYSLQGLDARDAVRLVRLLRPIRARLGDPGAPVAARNP